MSNYVTIVEADTYFESRYGSDAWDDAQPASGVDETSRAKAIANATLIIDRLNYRGKRTVATQVNQFPRNDDTTVPSGIQQACCEIALALLDGVDPEMEFENLNIVAEGYANVRSTYNRNSLPAHVCAGVPSVSAWHLLFPYLEVGGNIEMCRVS